jgi:hypothetical protein
MSQFEHDVTQVSVTITNSIGVVTEIGGGEKEKIKYKRKSPLFVFKGDTSGNTARGVNPDQQGEIEITLLKANPVNDIMQGLAFAGQSPDTRKLGLDTFTVQVTDRMTNKPLCYAALCCIEEQPEGAVELDPTETKWKVHSSRIVIAESGGMLKP